MVWIKKVGFWAKVGIFLRIGSGYHSESSLGGGLNVGIVFCFWRSTSQISAGRLVKTAQQGQSTRPPKLVFYRKAWFFIDVDSRRVIGGVRVRHEVAIALVTTE